MSRCILCDYPREAPAREQNAPLCALCAVRTTPEERMRYLSGRRIRACYMDSD